MKEFFKVFKVDLEEAAKINVKQGQLEHFIDFQSQMIERVSPPRMG